MDFENAKYEPSKKFSSFQDKPKSFLSKLRDRKIALVGHSNQRRMTHKTQDSFDSREAMKDYINIQMESPVLNQSAVVSPRKQIAQTKSRHTKSYSVTEQAAQS